MAIKNARIEAAILVMVVFVLGILLGGVGSHLWDERVEGQVQAQNAVQLNLKPTRNERVNDLTQRLQLTPDQQKQVGAVFDDTVSKWQALYAPLDATHEQIRQQGRANIRAVLTPDQQVKFDDFLRQLDEQRRLDEQRMKDGSH
jgi:Spy/CpxP family protein refolding chaperone